MSGRHACVIEDNTDIRLTIRMILEDSGYVVGEATDGQAGLELVREMPGSAVVVLDLMLPIMSGARVVQAVAADPALAARRVFILVTARREGIPAELVTLPDGLWLRLVQKPFDLETLLDAVDDAEHALEARGAGTAK